MFRLGRVHRTELARTDHSHAERPVCGGTLPQNPIDVPGVPPEPGSRLLEVPFFIVAQETDRLPPYLWERKTFPVPAAFRKNLSPLVKDRCPPPFPPAFFRISRCGDSRQCRRTEASASIICQYFRKIPRSDRRHPRVATDTALPVGTRETSPRFSESKSCILLRDQGGYDRKGIRGTPGAGCRPGSSARNRRNHPREGGFPSCPGGGNTL